MIAVCVLQACGPASFPAPPIAQEPGQLVEQEDLFGTFYTYVPTTLPEMPEILALVHGTPPKDETAEANAEFYGANWTEAVNQSSFVLKRLFMILALP